jgi:hypothetical protein
MSASEINSPRKHLHYQIKVEGILNESWSDWFGGFTITSTVETNGVPITTLIGTLPDQAALRGVLVKLWYINATLLEVQLINPNPGDLIHKLEVQK